MIYIKTVYLMITIMKLPITFIEKIWFKAKKIDQEYRTTLINFGQSKYFIINFAMAKLMKMEQTDRNKVALYLFNNIKIQ